MELNPNFKRVFLSIPIFGMIHLAGDNTQDKTKRALEEISIYEEEGVDCAIIENYHTRSLFDLSCTLSEIKKNTPNIKIGVNVLPNDFHEAFNFVKRFDLSFIQLDHVAGKYIQGKLDFDNYEKEKPSDTFVLGGVWPKYYNPVSNSNLEKDLKTGMKRAEAIVVTGERTGKEVPIEKIKNFREILGTYPLIIGAGLNLNNAYDQLIISDGAIVGSALKVNDYTENPVDRIKVREFMQITKEARKYQASLNR